MADNPDQVLIYSCLIDRKKKTCTKIKLQSVDSGQEKGLEHDPTEKNDMYLKWTYEWAFERALGSISGKFVGEGGVKSKKKKMLEGLVRGNFKLRF